MILSRKSFRIVAALAAGMTLESCVPNSPPQHVTRNTQADVELVKEYQQRTGLYEDGIVGKATCEFLMKNKQGIFIYIGDAAKKFIDCHDCPEQRGENKLVLELANKIAALYATDVNHTFTKNQGTVEERCSACQFQIK